MKPLSIYEIEKPKTLLHIKITKEDFKKNYSLRGRIGIHIARFFGIADIERID